MNAQSNFEADTQKKKEDICDNLMVAAPQTQSNK